MDTETLYSDDLLSSRMSAFAWLDSYPLHEHPQLGREWWRKQVQLRVVTRPAPSTVDNFERAPHLLMAMYEGRNFAHFIKDNLWPVHSVLDELLKGGFTSDNQILLVPGVHDTVPHRV